MSRGNGRPGRRLSALLGLSALLAGVAAGCGGPVHLDVVPIETPKQIPSAPPQTAEERDGEVPPLRGMPPKRALVPANLIPPAPPEDPQPAFE